MRDRFNFRIYDTKHKVMRTSDFFVTANGFAGELIDMNTSDDENTLFKMRCLVIAEKHFSELMQCTGLKDKNGKLIFEGDILKEKYFDSDKEQFEYAYLQIGYDEKWCSYYQQVIDYDYKEAFPEFDFKEENIEVIGNIYENPELLKGDFNE